jgi:two-component system KDP operon response regulator KdpE
MPPARIGDVLVDMAAKRVIRQRPDAEPAGQFADIQLTPTEWRLLEVLLSHPGQLVSRQQLLARRRGPATPGRPATSGCISRNCAASWSLT